MALTLSELIQLVGNDRIKVQNLLESATDFKMVSKGRELSLTFVTSPDHVDLGAVAIGGIQRWTGLVIWLPSDRVKMARLHGKALG